MTDDRAGRYPDVAAQPDFPRIEERILERWERDGTFFAVDRPARGPARRRRVRVLRRPAVRQRPAPLRPPAHRLRQGHRAALPDDAGPGRPPALRLGLPRPAGRGRGREASWASPGTRRSPPTASPRSTTPAARACCATPTSGSATSTARPAGSTSRTTTRPWTSTTWRASCGRSSRCGTRASSTRASGCSPTAGAARRRCATPRRGWTTSTATARTRR